MNDNVLIDCHSLQERQISANYLLFCRRNGELDVSVSLKVTDGEERQMAIFSSCRAHSDPVLIRATGKDMRCFYLHQTGFEWKRRRHGRLSAVDWRFFSRIA